MLLLGPALHDHVVGDACRSVAAFQELIDFALEYVLGHLEPERHATETVPAKRRVEGCQIARRFV